MLHYIMQIQYTKNLNPGRFELGTTLKDECAKAGTHAILCKGKGGPNALFVCFFFLTLLIIFSVGTSHSSLISSFFLSVHVVRCSAFISRIRVRRESITLSADRESDKRNDFCRSSFEQPV